MCRYSFIVIPVILLATISSLFSSEQLFPGSGVQAEAEHIPSALWPQYIETTRDIKVGDSKAIKNNTRGVLLRAEGDQLIIDFGRDGIAYIDPAETNFYAQVSKLILGETEKEFPNLALQIGNKLMTFGRGKKSGPIRFDEALNIELYVLLYLENYSSDISQSLIDFGLAYKALKTEWPNIEVVLMPKDRKFYDFGNTVGYSVPYIAPHMRIGYINSLSHGVNTPPGFVAVDRNGRILGRSIAPIEWGDLTGSLQKLLNGLDVSWSAPEGP